MTRASDAIDPTTASPRARPRSTTSAAPPPRRGTSLGAIRMGRLLAFHPPRRLVRVLAGAIGVTAVSAVILIVGTPTSATAIDVFGALRGPGEPALIIGHRGDRAEAPENTMPSLELAMDRLAYVETDVQMSRDGVPMLFHDTDLERITGDRRSVGDLDARQLQRLDVGAWYGTAFEGERMPTLEAFLEELAERPDARALVELKADWADDEVRTVVGLIDRVGLRGRVVLESFSLETLFAIQRVSPTTPRIMLIRELPADPVPMAERLGLIGFGTTATSVTAEPQALAALHEAEIAVLCYTLNTEDRWEEVGALGVDGIITDEPSELDEWLAVTAPGT
ncbi:glycerophosphodiester phosphodiesterase [Agromyces salentinus]|uniref:glycerophosphodiester phosphodiesterase n=1 Tax=Agromyces salentinus TaxID=269421 RepID=UPI0012FCB9C4|nr:glycerophosphodiester phosphodiesterase family protein [Agromyces salentinus]